MTYDEWADEVGIFKDSESREAWDYQQKRIDKLVKQIQDLGQEGYDDV